MDNSIIKEDDTVIFDINGEKQAFVIAKPKTKIKMGKGYVSAEPLIGCPFGTLFSLSADGKSLERTEHVPSKEWDEKAEVTRDNSKLVDENKNQALTQSDIAAMKEAGKGGTEIIEALTTHSATFDTKTEFAQEKYKKRKARKYVLVACARRPTAASICAAHYSKGASRIGYLRPDSLGLLLHMANVGPGAKILVLESCGGMVTGAVMERMGGYGTVCSTHVGPKAPSIDICKSFNASAEVLATVRTAPLSQLLLQRHAQRQEKAEKAAAATVRQSAETEEQPKKEGEKEAAAEAIAADGGSEEQAADAVAPAVGESAAAPMEVAASAAEEQQQQPAAAADISSAAGSGGPPFSGCILASPSLDPNAALRALFPLLSPSASFAVAGPCAQPLAECMNSLRTDGLAVNMTVQEAWMREQQVLPMRTHPTMNMNHGGGYLLSGTLTVAGSQLALVLSPTPVPPFPAVQPSGAGS